MHYHSTTGYQSVCCISQPINSFCLNFSDSIYLEVVSNDMNSGLHSFKVDTSAIHGKFIGDSWFGGCSWTTDERYFAYVAMTKQADKTTYFSSGIINVAHSIYAIMHPICSC